MKRDYYSPDVFIPVEQPTPKGFSKTVTVGGKEYEIEGNSADELVRIETELLRQLINASAETPTPNVQARDEQGQFVAREDAHAQRVVDEENLRLQLMRGEISVNEFVAQSVQSGALDSYLKENFGLDRQEIAGKRVEEEWIDATKRWMADNPSWEGGQVNSATVQQILLDNDLADAADKYDALNRAVAFARENNMLVTPPEVAKEKALKDDFNNASSIEDLRSAGHRALGIPDVPTDSWTFDRR
ncbi:MAG: hypothetical protein WB780_22360 [Candidatus Acidiferrales bacterium]